MSQQLTIFCSSGLDEAAKALLAQETSGYRVSTDPTDSTHAEIVFGQIDPQKIIESTRLKWIHISSAGYTRYDTEEVRRVLRQRKIAFTNSSHVYDIPCAQHALALMMADARQLFPCYEAQRTNRDWQSDARRQECYLLNGQTILLLGMGAIAQYLIRLLQPFDMEIIAARRSGQPQEGIEVVGVKELDEVLPRADHIVNLLPESASTIGFMDAARFAKIKPGAKFYNIGRGKTVDQDALIEALRQGQLGAAYLDVTDPEPLPPDHPLWTTPRCYITPHSAGGHQDEYQRLVRHFVQNLRAFEAGEPMRDCVWEI